MKTLRILFTIICAVCLAALYPVGVFLDFPFVFGLIAIGGVSFLLMLWCRKKQLTAEQKQTPQQPQGDFFQPIEQKGNGNSPQSNDETTSSQSNDGEN